MNSIIKHGSNVILSGIPFVGSLYSELISYFDEKKLETRLQNLENKIKENTITIENLNTIIEKFTEHEYYVLRNNIRNMIVLTLPEVVDTYNNAIVQYIKDKPNRGIIEETNEIISQLNSNDIKFLSQIKKFIHSDVKQQEKENHTPKLISSKHKGSWVDRNYIFGKNTIFTKDFWNYCNTNPQSLPIDVLVNTEFQTNDNKIVYDFAFQGKSILKLRNLGVITTDFVLTAGTSSTENIDRVHVTQLGQKLLEYID